MEICTEDGHEEILNGSHPDWPLFEGVIYGDVTFSLKLAKRLVCGVKHLPVRLTLNTITDTQAAIDVGVSHDPTLFINGEPLIEGLISAEEITIIFEHILKKGIL